MIQENEIPQLTRRNFFRALGAAAVTAGVPLAIGLNPLKEVWLWGKPGMGTVSAIPPGNYSAEVMDVTSLDSEYRTFKVLFKVFTPEDGTTLTHKDKQYLDKLGYRYDT